MESFVAGFAYGATTVLVGQPLDTIKTLQQLPNNNKNNNKIKGGGNAVAASPARESSSITAVARRLYASGGVPAFWRGGFPLLLGGGLMRSAQFGVYKNSLAYIRELRGGPTKDSQRVCFGVLDPQVILAGFCGGVGRGLVEGPFEMVKVRRQVVNPWSPTEVFKGSGTTLVRNSFLFASFAIYMDVYDRIVPAGVSPFWKGGVCANLAWLTIWPLDVVKSRMQSGQYEGLRMAQVLLACVRNGDMYKGLSVGLVRSFIANGSSMVVYSFVEKELKKRWNP